MTDLGPGSESRDGASVVCHGLVSIVQTEKAGRGLVASQAITAHTVLFVAPTIRVPKAQYQDHCRHTIFDDYLFVGPSGDYHLCLHLGSIFNHSKTPNVMWRLREAIGHDTTITFSAWRDINEGEPLVINYGEWGRQYESESESSERGEEEDEEMKEGALFNSLFA